MSRARVVLVDDDPGVLRDWERILRSGVLLSSRAGHLLSDQTPWPKDFDWRSLTLRQRELLELLSLGHTDKRLAEETGLGLTAIRWHVRALCRWLGVHSRAEAVARLLEGGRGEQEGATHHF